MDTATKTALIYILENALALGLLFAFLLGFFMFVNWFYLRRAALKTVAAFRQHHELHQGRTGRHH